MLLMVCAVWLLADAGLIDPSGAVIEASTIAEFLDPRIAFRFVLRIAKIVNRRAFRTLLGIGIIRAENPVPNEISDAEIALLGMVMMGHVQALHVPQKCPWRRDI